MIDKKLSDFKLADVKKVVKEFQSFESRVEFKRIENNPDKSKTGICKAVSAFANTTGGFLFFGIDDQSREMVGVNKKIVNTPVLEWLNQIISSGVEPEVAYPDPVIISLPKSENILVLMEIPESSNKPHMLMDKSFYPIRIGHQSKPAGHYKVKEMFESSKNKEKQLEEFLKKRNLLDELDPSFGTNPNSDNLFSELPGNLNIPKPFLLLSIIPEFPLKENSNISSQDLNIWLGNNSRGYKPLPDSELFPADPNGGSLKMECTSLTHSGVVFKMKKGTRLNFYFEVLKNGYLEAGFSKQIFWSNTDGRYIYISNIIGIEMMILGFVKKWYDFLGFNKGAQIQISLVNILGFLPQGLNRNYDTSNIHRRINPNDQHKTLRLVSQFNTASLTEERIKDIAKVHSLELCNAFGLEKDFCFYDNEITPNRLSDLLSGL